MIDKSDLLVVGVITQAHGIKGWVKVKSFMQSESNICNYSSCYLDHQGKLSLVEIEQARPQGKAFALKLKGVDDRNQSELLKRAQLLVPIEILKDLDDDEFYWHQLEGLQVKSAVTQQLLGKVDYLLETGSNDVLVIKPTADSFDDRERLIPYLPDVVLNVDLKSSMVEVDWDLDF
ncbi:MAG: ribosome maturation factor RimM [Sinobacterium sp.]|nr:ribosome maturation factor RimM [Sinobacterium sp.]